MSPTFELVSIGICQFWLQKSKIFLHSHKFHQDFIFCFHPFTTTMKFSLFALAAVLGTASAGKPQLSVRIDQVSNEPLHFFLYATRV
jgi:hypothetical protein